MKKSCDVTASLDASLDRVRNTKAERRLTGDSQFLKVWRRCDDAWACKEDSHGNELRNDNTDSTYNLRMNINQFRRFDGGEFFSQFLALLLRSLATFLEMLDVPSFTGSVVPLLSEVASKWDRKIFFPASHHD